MGGGRQLVIPAPQFRVGQEAELGSVHDLKRRQTRKAAAKHTPLNLPTWDHLAVLTRYSQETGPDGSPVIAEAALKGANRRLPVKGQRRTLLVVPFGDPESGGMRGFIPHAHPCGVTTAVPHCNAVS